MSVFSRGHHHVLFFFQKSLRQLFWSSLLRQTGFALADIYTFIYIYRVGITYQFFSPWIADPLKQGFITVVSNVLILRAVELIAIFPLTSIAVRLGLPRAAIVGNVLMAIRYGLLALSLRYPVLIFSAAVIQGIEMSIFGPAYDTLFARRASATRVGRDVSSFMFILRLINALVPAFAGGLIATIGFQAAFSGTTLLLLLANIPLFAIRWKETLTKPSVRDLFSWYRHRVDGNILCAIAGRYISDIGLELWPIYLLIVIGKIERLGFLMSFALVASLLLTYISGWYVDHSRKNTTFIASGVLLSLLWLFRIDLTLVTLIVFLEVAQKVIEGYFYPSFDARLYKISKHSDTFTFHVYRAVVTAILSLIVWSFLGFLCLWYGLMWNWIFVAGAIGMISSTLLYLSNYE